MSLLDTEARGPALLVRWSLAAPSDRIWQVLTGPEHLQRWLGRVLDGRPAPDSSFTVDHGTGYHCASTVLDFQPHRCLRYTWNFPDEPASTVSWHLSPGARLCTLTLEHEGLGELLPEYRTGWLTHLTYLEAEVRGAPLPWSMSWNLHSTFAGLQSA